MLTPDASEIDQMGLETEPACILAQAFQDHGGYTVDDAAWDVYALVTGWGPAGRVTDEFERAWGDGHLRSGSRKHYGYEARTKHIDLHVKHFSKTRIVVSDEFGYAVSDKQGRRGTGACPAASKTIPGGSGNTSEPIGNPLCLAHTGNIMDLACETALQSSLLPL